MSSHFEGSTPEPEPIRLQLAGCALEGFVSIGLVQAQRTGCALGAVNDRDGAGRGVDQRVADGSEHESYESAVSSGSDHQEAGPVCGLDQYSGRETLDD